MGGYNSGGHNRRGRPTVEQCSRLFLKGIKACGLLRPGAVGTAHLGEELLFEIHAFEDGMRLSLPHSRQQKFIRIEWHPRTFGGVQGYFLCPDCEGRCTSLLLFRGCLSCRKCWGFPYASQRSRRYDRLLLKARKAEASLRGLSPTQCIGMDPPPKPKGMHAVTYWRLIQPILRASDEFIIEASKRLGLKPL